MRLWSMMIESLHHTKIVTPNKCVFGANMIFVFEASAYAAGFFLFEASAYAAGACFFFDQCFW